VDRFLALLTDPDETVAWAAKEVCKVIIKNSEQCIPRFIQWILERGFNGTRPICERSIFLLRKIIVSQPNYITAELIDRLFTLGLEADADVSWIAFAAYRAAIANGSIKAYHRLKMNLMPIFSRIITLT
jgi:hypothetical protein